MCIPIDYALQIAMKLRFSFAYLLLVAVLVSPGYAQDAFFLHSNLEDGAAAAKEQDKLVMVYYYDAENGSADAYNHIWSDPLVARFVDKLAVPVVISSDSEAGEAFAGRKKKWRRSKSNPTDPGIYFFSDTGRTLGVLRGALDGQEGIGQMMLMLGAADYARHENKTDRRRGRYMRYWH